MRAPVDLTDPPANHSPALTGDKGKYVTPPTGRKEGRFPRVSLQVLLNASFLGFLSLTAVQELVFRLRGVHGQPARHYQARKCKKKKPRRSFPDTGPLIRTYSAAVESAQAVRQMLEP